MEGGEVIKFASDNKAFYNKYKDKVNGKDDLGFGFELGFGVLSGAKKHAFSYLDIRVTSSIYP